ncbi:MAG TPA: GNAT family N-acetyltransferase [Spirochaetota bacterium]|nr:GNAT family N-acetyltransferase [Spirochaetota bacterium]OPZ35176.1 MAG: Amino-acid acetyltransferase [Spirochaetes bacterium ADurb.BinA120]HNU91078.1 GNAT family N-acetyltransferase [Spirochaetota bacterium]HPI15357.1 GNAT family N-acetyltransferase [Spirochaetota bacterium]HPO46820.1 GNAT family N-acetyltransferase [Spirochaetota bacterium]
MQAEIREAVTSDVESIYRLLAPYSLENIILERSRKDISNSIDKFLVAVHNSAIIGVVSYYDYGPMLKEVRSLAVKKGLGGRGAGSELVRELLSTLHGKFPGAKVFVLTYSPAFFIRLGFVEVARETLPEKIWKDCDHCKNRDNCGETALVFDRGTGK